MPTSLSYEDASYRLGSVRVGNALNPLFKLDYTYFPTGNVQAIVDAHAGRQQTFGYDKLSRLTSVTGTGGYPGATFSYDAHGNRQGAGLTYYPGNFRLKSIGGFGDLVYDDNGNLTHHQGGAFQYSYTPDNRLSTATAAGVTTQVAYDADAWRVKTTVSGGATTYSVRGLAGELLSEWTETSPNPTIRDYIYAGSRLLAAITSGSGSGGGGGGGVPTGWSQADVGPVAVAGSASHSGGTFTVAGAGADIWGTSDEFHYVSQPLTGDGQIVARVLSVEYVHHWTKAGVMMRESLTAGSTHAYMLVSADRGLAFQHRTATGGSSTSTDGGAGTAPVWVRLTRVGDTFTAERSANGTSWTLVGTETITMATTIYVGLAVTSHDTSATATATFDNVSVDTVGGGGLPSGWSHTDIGAVGVAGSASHSGATFAVAGAGADIWDTSDGFHDVSQPLTGDGQIVARVPSVEYVHHWTKAGVMMRETLTAGSTHAYMLVSADRGLAFQRRTSTGGTSTSTDGGAGTAPVWVRLTRSGHTFTAERSANGVSWTLVGTETITMATTIYVGLAVTSHDTSATATATFDNVVVP